MQNNPLAKYLGLTIGYALDKCQTMYEEAAHDKIMQYTLRLSPDVSIQGAEDGMMLMVKGKRDRCFLAVNKQGKPVKWKEALIEALEKEGINGEQALFQWGERQVDIMKSVSLENPEEIEMWSEDYLERASFVFTHPFDPSKTCVGIKVFDAATGQEKRKKFGRVHDEDVRTFAEPFVSPLSMQGAMALINKMTISNDGIATDAAVNKK